MPKYYCDYCDIFLTHDSPSVRKSHNEGWKHKAAVRQWYSQFEENQTQSLIDFKVREYENRAGVMPAMPFMPPPFMPGFRGVPPGFPMPPPGFSLPPGMPPPPGFPFPPGFPLPPGMAMPPGMPPGMAMPPGAGAPQHQGGQQAPQQPPGLVMSQPNVMLPPGVTVPTK
eukprot:TRINITY_DN18760_c0_g1_i1.p1 TRINITY_DN18760_c0_g1~~TRINITY_DN18760_c0_g1_i1.p1  ORF type:complete len:176 (-),score=31.38 TRINITY_DN18760_c0_g1_i1:27-533(-)